MTATDQPHCPVCRSRRVVPIGPADEEDPLPWKPLRLDPPTWRCQACGYRWRPKAFG